MTRIGLRASGSFVPEQKLTNQDLEKMVDTTDEWIWQRTGIRERRIAPAGMHASDLAVAAAQNCLSGLDIVPDLLLASCETSETACPYQASIIARRMNWTHLAAFDVNAACSGLVYGLAIAGSLMKTEGYRQSLVTAGEKMSIFTNYQDRRSCILFGDGASALLLSADSFEHEIIATELGCDASGSDYVKMGAREGDPFFWQDGQKVFRFAVRTISHVIDRLKEKTGLSPQARFHIVPHQANLRITQAVSETRGIPMDRFVMNIDRFGNTSSASIGLALDEAWKGNRFAKGDHVFLIGFGGGLSWAGAAVRW
ncbi:MAG: beta-ketoacyl-ACP synthase III [candidate division FCPU426 bacterium]